ncbi:4-O-dimethylallyl-L-tyrosine synthase [Madurella mycetomatis]|uniref:4-O-dimethylallyl-L-tyrosine synthase n=2 Tax=Madurella mycetomatis TaxID=100816 RepID=A0A175WA00_9PEZI|nr:4-O-dimethylallyl-L-tyrosine synthase [Madurella mycetomatis]
MTDNHTPLELSWSWSEKQGNPAVRYSVEPIGWAAGTGFDPLNTRATVELLAKTPLLAPTLDLSLYRHFLEALTVSAAAGQGRREDELTNSDGALSQTFIAFDLREHDMVVKYYFMPTLKARILGESSLELVQGAIKGLPNVGSSYQASLSALSDYINSHDESERPVVEIVGIDCVDPSKSRIKIYVRSQKADFASMLDAMTLGGRTTPLSEQARVGLAELWCAIFDLGSDTTVFRDPLPERKHRTAGLLYYLELKAGSPSPKAKVYLPVRHYARNDEQIARGLSDFLARRGKGLVGRSYYDGVARLCKQRRLKEGLGFHTYVTCAVDGDGLAVTAYFNPVISQESQSRHVE